MTTRTQQLAWRRLPAGDTVLYTCPSGKRTIIKNVTCYNNDTVARYFIVYVSNAANTVYGHVTDALSLVAGRGINVMTWNVMEAGQILRVFWSGAANAGDVMISGAELSV